MLTVTYARLALVEELFRYKSQGFALEPFPGYTPDQWGIKAHNRPWIVEVGRFAHGQRVLEVGGAYSLLPKYLADRFGVEAYIGDDFGASSGEPLWARWGDPKQLPVRYPAVRYIFQPMGVGSVEYLDHSFDRIFTVSTLEHIPRNQLTAVFRDMHRCLRPGGMELHAIDVPIPTPRRGILAALVERCPLLPCGVRRRLSPIRDWVEIIRESGVRIEARPPSSLVLLNRRVLAESADVVYRFYPPNDAPKPYTPAASLLVVIEDR